MSSCTKCNKLLYIVDQMCSFHDVLHNVCRMCCQLYILGSLHTPRQVDLVLRVSSHAVGHRFAPWSGHTKAHQKMVQTVSLLGAHALEWEFNNAAIGRVVCGNVYGNMHLKDLLGSIARLGYFNPEKAH